MKSSAHIGALSLVLVGCTVSDAVPGWVRATERPESPVPFQDPLANETIAIGDGNWLFNKRRVAESQLLEILREAATLSPQPILVADFAKIRASGERRRLKIAIAAVLGCTAEHPFCIEGTHEEYLRS